MKTNKRWTGYLVSVIALFMMSGFAQAQTDSDRIEDLERQAAQLAEQLAELKAELDQAKSQQPMGGMQSLREETTAARQAAQRAEQAASEWKNSQAVTHLSGYASADYISPENGSSAFVANFNPMFHYQYNEKILWEAELEFEVEENGDTDIGLEYSTIDWFLNDNFILVAGKFLSPLGTFRQNLHPSWINKLPTAPPGFGHDGAAPLAEVGLQLRGGTKVGERGRFTYAAYVGNGPKLEGEDGEIHAVETEGFAGDADDEKVFGGRVSFLPFPKLEVGVSAAFGDVAVVEDDGVDIAGDPTRDYDVFGFDGSFQAGNFDIRGEFIRQDIAEQALSVAPEGGKWETWYVQGAYRFGESNWEGVVRYTDFKSPHADDSQEQLAFGVNYLLTPSAMLKLGYESNDGLAGEATDEDRLIVQIAYGY